MKIVSASGKEVCYEKEKYLDETICVWIMLIQNKRNS